MDVFSGMGAWGNLEACVYLEYPSTAFYNFVDELIASFETTDVFYDSFDLDSNVVREGKLEDIGDTIIAAAHLSRNGEGIMVYHFQGLCSVEHFFRPRVLEQETGSVTMRKLITDYTIMGWALGFEWAPGVEKVRKNFDVIWSDSSLYPLIVLQQGKDTVPKEYGIYEPMLSILRAYEAKLSSPLPT